MAGTIVLGYDASPGARGALEQAHRARAEFGDKLVIALRRGARGQRRGGVARNAAALEEHGRGLTSEALEAAQAAGLEAEVAFVRRAAALGVADLASAHDARYIVVGGWGESPIRGAILGSTPHKLLHLSDRPVLGLAPRLRRSLGWAGDEHLGPVAQLPIEVESHALEGLSSPSRRSSCALTTRDPPARRGPRGRRRGRDLRRARPRRAAGRRRCAAARGLVHAGVVLAGARERDRALAGPAGARRLAPLPALGVRVGGARPRAAPGRPLARRRAGPRASAARPTSCRCGWARSTTTGPTGRIVSMPCSSAIPARASSSTRPTRGRPSWSTSWSPPARSTRLTSRASTTARQSTCRPTLSCTGCVIDAFPDAWIEDPDVTDETRPILEAHHERVTWDAPIHSIADIEARPWPPRMVNIKPSRFGSVRDAVRRLRLLRRARHRRLRRRPVRARRRPRPDPVPGLAVPSRHAERRGARRASTSREPPRRPADQPARAAHRADRLSLGPLTQRASPSWRLPSGFCMPEIARDDDEPLDLGGALEDRVDLRVAVHPLDRELARVAVAAEDLDRALGRPHGDLAGLELATSSPRRC